MHKESRPRPPLTRVERGQAVPGAQRLGLLEADFPWNVDVEQVNLLGESAEGRGDGYTNAAGAGARRGSVCEGDVSRRGTRKPFGV